MKKLQSLFTNFRQRLLVADCICALATASVLLVVLTSCSHTRYIPMPEVHQRDSLSTVVHKKVNNTYVERFHIERLLPTDTINSSPYAGGRGVLILDSIYVEKFTDVEVHDTVVVTHRDSIPYPVEVPVEVPAPIPRLYKNSLWFVILFLLYWLFRIAKAVYLRR